MPAVPHTDVPSREQGAWRDPEAVFTSLAAESDEVFWIDAGVDAATGWSWIGTGTPVDQNEVRDTVLAGAGRDLIPRWVGWFDYDTAAARAGAPATRDAGVSGRWMRVDRVVGFDHAGRRVFVPAESGVTLADLERWSAPSPSPEAPAAKIAAARQGPDDYAALIERCRQAIRAGDAYQLCLTTRFSVEGVVDAVDAYRRLRRSARTTRGGFVRIDGVALASATPESFLTVREGMVRSSPIKGTRPRGVDDADDARLVAELRDSVKERAENVMIVDLVRNDLARVCAPESVTVTRLLEVESYAEVHQLVSEVAGSLSPGTDLGAVLDAAFPAGSMSGAPKLSAMTILEGLEGGPRGAYAGCFGWVSVDGAVDLAMVIRTIVVDRSGATVGAGGGITWRSEAAAEVAEAALKARGPLAAIGAVLPAEWRV